jgi:predicted acylesterase/phospholipase RssA
MNKYRPSKQIQSLKRDLDHAESYALWREMAVELDRLEGASAWKEDEASDDYDYLLIKERLSELRALRRSSDLRQLVFRLAEGLHGNLGNLSNPMLYAYARVGTKQLVQTYLEEVARCIAHISTTDSPRFSHSERVLFLKRTGSAFGRSALLLSGGATLGMFHLGVIKALWEAGILPRVISGSSAGSIVAGMAATRSDEQMPQIFDPEGLNLSAFQGVSFAKILRGNTVMDGGFLSRCLQQNIGEESFVQAFERTRRILCVTVSPAEANQAPRLLNYLTAPNVIIRKAIQASCAIPGVFPSVMLEAMDFDGEITPYMRSKRWVDGTLSSDLPMLRLARLHNVNHYIVSQTNPHVLPFIKDHNPRNQGLGSFVREIAKVAGRDMLQITRSHLSRQSSAGRMVDKLNDVLQQRYSGDINILPKHSPQQLLGMLSNPNPSEIRQYIRDGERATWPKLERIRLQTTISRAFEDALFLMKQQAEARQVQMEEAALPTETAALLEPA